MKSDEELKKDRRVFSVDYVERPYGPTKMKIFRHVTMCDPATLNKPKDQRRPGKKYSEYVGTRPKTDAEAGRTKPVFKEKAEKPSDLKSRAKVSKRKKARDEKAKKKAEEQAKKDKEKADKEAKEAEEKAARQAENAQKEEQAKDEAGEYFGDGSK